MEDSRHQDLVCDVKKKCVSPEMSSNSWDWKHKNVEKKDSGFESRDPSPERPMSTFEDNSDTERTRETNTHRKLARTESVVYSVDSSKQATTPANIVRTPSAHGAASVISCLSMCSTFSKHHPPGFKAAHSGNELLKANESSALSIKSDKSMEPVGNFEVKTPNTRPCKPGEAKSDSDQDSFDSLETSPGRREDDLSFASLSSDCLDIDQFTDGPLPEPVEVSCQHKAMEELKEEYKNHLKLTLLEQEKRQILLNDVYVEPYITQEEAVKEDKSKEKSNVNEMRELNAAPARLNVFPGKWNILEQPPAEPRKIKTVLTKGIPGIGKSVCVQKFVLDWAEGKTHQEIDVILALSLKYLNNKKEENISLTELLHYFFPQIKQIQLNTVRVMLIFDGLDEYHLPLDFQNNPNCSDPSQPTAVDVLLTNLIKGNLIPSALLWITSRPGAANAIPTEYLQSVTEIQGFRQAQREEYFYKRIRDNTKANKIISHIDSSENLRRLCHIPAYCSLLVAVLQETLDNTSAPQTLVEILNRSLRANLHSEDHTD